MANSQSNQNKMEMEIVKQEKNPFMEREEFVLSIKNEVAPSFEEVKTELKKDAELTVVKKVNTNFGRQTFMVEAVVYDNKEAKNKVETIPQKIRKKMEAEKKAADEAAKKAEAEPVKTEEAAPVEEKVEEKKEETPVEETKEEVKAE
jgi:ribosomal protein S24E